MGELEGWVALLYSVLPVMLLIAAHFLHFLEDGGKLGWEVLVIWNKAAMETWPLDFKSRGGFVHRITMENTGIVFPFLIAHLRKQIKIYSAFISLWDNLLELVRVGVGGDLPQRPPTPHFWNVWISLPFNHVLKNINRERFPGQLYILVSSPQYSDIFATCTTERNSKFTVHTSFKISPIPVVLFKLFLHIN